MKMGQNHLIPLPTSDLAITNNKTMVACIVTFIALAAEGPLSSKNARDMGGRKGGAGGDEHCQYALRNE